jgi:mRNA interferase MazF
LPEYLRRQIWWVTHPDADIGRKMWVIVSNNGRNKNLNSVLGVRITTSPKKLALDMPTIVKLPQTPQLTGAALCDTVTDLPKAWFDKAPTMAVHPDVMQRIETGLRIAMDL